MCLAFYWLGTFVDVLHWIVETFLRILLIYRHGRKHDITPSKVNYRANIWALKEAGCTHVIVSSACGSLQEDIAPGDLVIPDSFIDL